MDQARVVRNSVNGLVQGAVGAEDGLEPAGQQIALPVPVAQLWLVDVVGDRLGGVPGEGLTRSCPIDHAIALSRGPEAWPSASS